MKRRWMWLVVAAVVVLSFVAGWVAAQEGFRRYGYLPAEYSEPYTPTRGESWALDLTARRNSERQLTQRLVSTSFEAQLRTVGLKLVVDTATQPTWRVWSGGGFTCTDCEVRAVYAEGVQTLLARVRKDFPQIVDEDVVIEFYIHGAPVGTWTGGKMTLEGEE